MNDTRSFAIGERNMQKKPPNEFGMQFFSLRYVNSQPGSKKNSVVTPRQNLDVVKTDSCVVSR
jgi:hypothetical protein